LVDAGDYCYCTTRCITCICCFFSYRTLYLSLVLMKLDSIKITQTLLVLALALMAVHLFTLRLINSANFLYLTIVFIVLALFPQFFLSGFIANAWLKFGEAMSWVMSKIILGLLFYLFVFPISSLYRMLNKDLLMLEKRKDSYYTERNHLFEKKDIENPW